MKKGLFITFEGIDGCGKSTQSARTIKVLKDAGLPVTATREPGGTPLAEKIRALILDPANTSMVWKTELLLYNASRIQHLEEKVIPALEKGRIVVCDRYYDATVAYQGYGRKLDVKLITGMHRLVTGNFQPERTIILDLPVSEARQRHGETGKTRDRLENEADAFQKRIRTGYRALAKAAPRRCRLINARGTADQTFDKIMAVMNPLIKRFSA